MKRRTLKQWFVGSAVAMTTWSASFTAAATETTAPTLAHTGRMFDAQGDPLVELSTVTFAIYDAQTGGKALWSEAVEVDFDDGHFSVRLGETKPLAPALLDGKTRWLAMAVPGAPRTARAAITTTPAAPEAPRSEQPVNKHAESTPARPSGVVLAAAHVDAELGSLPTTSDYRFLGGTLRMSVEQARQILVSATAGLGSTAQTGAAHLHLSVCARAVGDTRLIDNRGDRLDNLTVAANSQQSFAVRSRFAGLPPGDYDFGLCGYVDADTHHWNNNSTSRVAVLVTAP